MLIELGGYRFISNLNPEAGMESAFSLGTASPSKDRPIGAMVEVVVGAESIIKTPLFITSILNNSIRIAMPIITCSGRCRCAYCRTLSCCRR